MYLNNKELATIVGGGLSATFLNAISRAASLIYDVGYSIGSTLRRLISGKRCKL